MKYTIEGFSQEEALSLKKEVIKKVDGKAQTKILKLDVIDLMLLRWFVDFYPNMKKKIIGETQYAWVNYQSIVNDLPLLDIEKRPVYNRFLKMCELGILIHHHDKVGGSFSYYSFGENYSRLIKKPTMNQNSQGYESKFIGGMNQNSQGVGTKIPTKDSSINNSSINNSFSIKEYEEEKEKKETNNQYSETEIVVNKIKKIPDETIRNKLLEIMKTRERKGKPITTEVLKTILERLHQYSGGSKEKQIEILNVSVMNGYDTVFLPNSYYNNPKSCNTESSYNIDDWERATSGSDYLLNAMNSLM